MVIFQWIALIVGGIVIIWREPFEVSIQSFSLRHIDCVVKHGSSSCRFTGFYGNPVVSLRNTSWQLLQRLAGVHELNQLVASRGKFQRILFESEKVGGPVKSMSQI